ncbi:MAG TPA: glycoside hydrolase family 28 protein [Chitinophagaceae bacterium]|nr:glycoside hydrolase family 28 protein [Chitinophagaceae bacterium]
MKKFILFFCWACFLYVGLQAQYNVKNFGAKGNGTALETRSIQQAIDKAWQAKGGVVVIPPGTYKIGTLILKDNVELQLQAGAMLLGSPDYHDYTVVKQQLPSRTRELYARYFMIFAEGARNISITGSGTIYGNGLKHFQESRPQNLRPYMIRFVNCENVIIRDVKLLESANWTLHLLGCREVNVDGIVIETNGEGNRDGLDIDASQRVKISNSRFSTTDDAIVLKATRDELCENVVITNCIVLACGGSGIKTGTESNGGFRNITVSNCTINNIPVHAGIELMTVDGGVMENILMNNISMNNVGTPFFIRLGIRARPFEHSQYVTGIGDVKDITLSNITVHNAKLPSSIIGLHSQPIKNITVSNYTARYAETQLPVAYNKVPFEEFEYPAAAMFKDLPAYGLYCRSVDGLNLQNLNIYSADNEKRPALALDRVNNAAVYFIKAEVKGQASPLIHVRNSDNLSASFCQTSTQNNNLIEIEGNEPVNFRVSGNILQPAQKEIARVEKLPDESIFEDFKTEVKYSVASGEKQDGLYAHDLKTGPLKIKLNTKKGALQLCLLVLNTSSKPEKVLIKYDGIVQEFQVSWNKWGWAPISLLKQYNNNEQVEFEIISVENRSELKIAKAYLRYQDIGFTD